MPNSIETSNLLERKKLLDLGVDYFEVTNGLTMDYQSISFAKRYGAGVITGSVVE